MPCSRSSSGGMASINKVSGGKEHKEIREFVSSPGICADSLSEKELKVLLLRDGAVSRGINSAEPENSAVYNAEELAEIARLAPDSVKKLSGWTKDIRGIPAIDIGHVKAYLMATKKIEFSAEEMQSYRLSRPWQFVKAEAIHSDEDVKWMHVILDKLTGNPVAGYCICTVGIGRACAHLGALLFLLAELIADGIQHLKDGPTCTEILCKWTKPKGAKAEPVQTEEVFHESESRAKGSKKKVRPTPSVYKTLIPSLPAMVQHERAIRFQQELRLAAEAMDSVPPALHLLDATRYDPSNVLPSGTGDLSNQVDHEEEVVATPPAICEMIQPNS